MSARESSQEPTPVVAPWGKWDRAGIWIILGGAGLVALGALVGGTSRVVQALATGTHFLTLAVETSLPAEADTGTALLLRGNYESAFVAVTNLTGETTALLTAADILGVITETSVALSFVYLAWRLLKAKPFVRSLTVAFSIAGSVLALGSLIGQFLAGFGRWQVALELGPADAGTDTFWPLIMNIDPAPIAFGFALLVVASAFYYGDRLSRETEGLV
jgi:hypothetical protein